MKIVLLEDVKPLGKKGDLCEVNDGYGRNFLIARKKAVEATPANLNTLKLQKANAEKIAAENLAAAKDMAEKISGRTYVLKIKGGAEGKTFGSVSSKEIAAAVQEAAGVEVDKKKIVLPDAIKQVGEYEIPVKLHKDVNCNIKIKVVQE